MHVDVVHGRQLAELRPSAKVQVQQQQQRQQRPISQPQSSPGAQTSKLRAEKWRSLCQEILFFLRYVLLLWHFA